MPQVYHRPELHSSSSSKRLFDCPLRPLDPLSANNPLEPCDSGSSPNKLANVQAQLTKLVTKNYYLHKSARDAYRSYLHAYNSHALKDVYDVHTLDLAGCAASFGFEHPPKVTLMLKADKSQRGKGSGKGADKKAGGSGHKFSADNPYGKREANDKRQFSH